MDNKKKVLKKNILQQTQRETRKIRFFLISPFRQLRKVDLKKKNTVVFQQKKKKILLRLQNNLRLRCLKVYDSGWSLTGFVRLLRFEINLGERGCGEEIFKKCLPSCCYC